ncbi:hypothetical protein [Dactylosporangium matsuzakiense]|uniref:hypothetical protein n=1 Tax=Dactylosporangium matsuzakiense TaxID=53360 RepID=UPI0021C2DB28|nr:hypothetical protein [Dactylosporangium matsuzakiense]UWZ48332.1 hypothetical protein Dmats_19135 [Dactylosporangium matsuzakiense]
MDGEAGEAAQVGVGPPDPPRLRVKLCDAAGEETHGGLDLEPGRRRTEAGVDTVAERDGTAGPVEQDPAGLRKGDPTGYLDPAWPGTGRRSN